MASVLEKELYDAALKGDVTTSLQLLQQDPYLVERVSFSCSRNLLHVATMLGQALIVAEVLKVNPNLARNLDSQNLSPLHIAAAQGNVEVAKILLSVAPEMCWWRDGQGMNPVHIAAMSGNVGVLEEFIREDSMPAMERVHRGQTVLHLCAKHRQLAVLKVLMERLGQLVPCFVTTANFFATQPDFILLNSCCAELFWTKQFLPNRAQSNIIGPTYNLNNIG